MRDKIFKKKRFGLHACKIYNSCGHLIAGAYDIKMGGGGVDNMKRNRIIYPCQREILIEVVELVCQSL